MADWLKIATRIAVCVAMLAASVALVAWLGTTFTGLPVGDLWALATRGIGSGSAILHHYFGDSVASWLIKFTVGEIGAYVMILIGTTLWQATRWLDHVWQ